MMVGSSHMDTEKETAQRVMEQDRNMTGWSYQDQAFSRRERQSDRSLEDPAHLPFKKDGVAETDGEAIRQWLRGVVQPNAG